MRSSSQDILWKYYRKREFLSKITWGQYEYMELLKKSWRQGDPRITASVASPTSHDASS